MFPAIDAPIHRVAAMWGTDWPSPGVKSMRANVDAFPALPLPDAARRDILSGNAARIWG